MSRITIVLAILFVCCLATADIQETTLESIEASLGQPFELKNGQVAHLVQEGLDVEFLEIVEDSLCPENAKCTWEGVAVIRLKVVKDQQEHEYFLAHRPGKQSHNGIAREATTDHCRIRLLSFNKGSALLNVSKGTGNNKNSFKDFVNAPLAKPEEPKGLMKYIDENGVKMDTSF